MNFYTSILLKKGGEKKKKKKIHTVKKLEMGNCRLFCLTHKKKKTIKNFFTSVCLNTDDNWEKKQM